MLNHLITIFILCILMTLFTNVQQTSSYSSLDIKKQERDIKRRDTSENESNLSPLLSKVLSRVELALRFFAQDYASVNLDGLWGLRFGQGQISVALSECKDKGQCPQHLVDRLQAIYEGIQSMGEAAEPYVKEADPVYFHHFEEMVTKEFLVPDTSKRLGDLDKYPIGTNHHYDEEKGDECMNRLMGTYEDNGRPVPKCNITESCKTMMTENNTCEYTVTHQLFYTLIAERKDCVAELEDRFKVSMAETRERLCGSIYNEAKSFVKNKNVDPSFQDLFMEQVLLCGCSGFEDFMQDDWIKMIMTWQRPNGCFSLPDDMMVIVHLQEDSEENQHKRILNGLKWEVQMIEKQHPQHQTRQLLRESIMKDDCLAHASGLGFGVLSTFAKFLIRQQFLN